MVLGTLLMLLGWGLLVLIVMGYLTSSFTLNFVAYAASITGLMMGFWGLERFRRPGR